MIPLKENIKVGPHDCKKHVYKIQSKNLLALHLFYISYTLSQEAPDSVVYMV